MTYDACGGSGWNDLDHAAQLTGNFGKKVCSSKQTQVEPNRVRGCEFVDFISFSREALHFWVGVFGIRNAKIHSVFSVSGTTQVHHCHIGSFATSGQPPGVLRQSLQSIETFESESLHG